MDIARPAPRLLASSSLFDNTQEQMCVLARSLGPRAAIAPCLMDLIPCPPAPSLHLRPQTVHEERHQVRAGCHHRAACHGHGGIGGSGREERDRLETQRRRLPAIPRLRKFVI